MHESEGTHDKYNEQDHILFHQDAHCYLWDGSLQNLLLWEKGFSGILQHSIDNLKMLSIVVFPFK